MSPGLFLCPFQNPSPPCPASDVHVAPQFLAKNPIYRNSHPKMSVQPATFTSPKNPQQPIKKCPSVPRRSRRLKPAPPPSRLSSSLKTPSNQKNRPILTSVSYIFSLLQIPYMFPLSSLNDPLMITHRFFPGIRTQKPFLTTQPCLYKKPESFISCSPFCKKLGTREISSIY